MGRNKKFDLDQALDKAMLLFWEKGYENTSLNELLKAMGILNGSFYNTFGDKKKLFIQVIEHYKTRMSGERINQLLDSENASQGIRVYFKDFYSNYKSEKTPTGCMIAKCLNKKDMADPELNKVLEAAFIGLIKVFQTKIQQSIDNGDLKTQHSAKDLATLVFSHQQGVIKTSSLNIPISTLQRQTDIFLQALGL